MQILYGNINGSIYVKTFAFPFTLYYLESPFINAMTALGKNKEIMIYDLLASALRITLLFLLLPSMKIMGVAISTSISFILIVFIFGVIIFKSLKEN
jgi:O-antigen/teichoic acid export membrane protein